MAHLLRFQSRDSRQRVLAGGATVLLHAALFLLLFSANGRFDGLDNSETSVTRLVLLEAPKATRSDGDESFRLTPVIPAIAPPDMPVEPRELPEPEAQSEPEPAPIELADAAAPAVPAEPEPITLEQEPSPQGIEPAKLTSNHSERSALSRQLAKLAEELLKAPNRQVTWEQDGKVYRAMLAMQPASNGVDFDRVLAQVSAEDHGRQFTTNIRLKRLAFSHYTQMIDRWDPMVHLHDDEIVGRFHVNSQFNVMYDRRTMPVFLGKVTTAARNFNTESEGRRRDAEIFRAGIETRAGRIVLPQKLRPFEWAPSDEDVRKHEFLNDVRIRFSPDGSYSVSDRNTDAPGQVFAPSKDPVYFIGSSAAVLYVQGTVSGKMLVYSPHKIVIEDNLVYAHDPREVADSDDYLGLVCDRYVEVAAPEVTGPGDIEIHAAIFAGRRFTVRDIYHSPGAAMRIYGSVAAGSVSASEPRYSTRIEYDSRFEQQRPPGFPSTDRFAAEDWNGEWIESLDP